ncbi:MAG: hypothetical protein IT355_19095 [Gemmatimonadaceae bacterium]|nr:hypothetical protein [Gemmatimonadaceae bacterium]
MINLARTATVLAAAFLAACASDGTTNPASSSPTFETRLSAAASAPTASLADSVLTLNLAVTNSLSETVSGGICATMVQARAASGTTWTDVTSSIASCPQSAVLLPPGATVNFRATADPAKVRTVAGGSTGIVVFRVRHTLAGSTEAYTLQSNEVTWTLN